jgi:hypothetical protein
MRLVTVLVVSPLLLLACGGSGDSGVIAGKSSGGSGGDGASTSAGGSSGSSDGGSANSGGAGGKANTGGGKSSGGAGNGGTGNGGTGNGGTGNGGTSGAGGAATGGAGNGGAAGTGGTPDAGSCPLGVGSGGQCLNSNGQVCTADGECASGHCVGGSCCQVACAAPGACQTLAGTSCQAGTTCVYGKQADTTACDDGDACTTTACFNGACLVNANKDCSDADQCTTDTCAPATGACSHTALPASTCDDNNPCTTDSCNGTAGCQHTPNTATCTDGNPCTNDICGGGICVSTAKDCSSLTNACNTGVCNAGTCEAQPINLNGACPAPGACDAGGACNAAGACIGKNDACGTLATSCSTPCSGGSCFQNRLCTCTGTNSIVSGVCVPNTNECNANPCDAKATCNDPTPSGSVTGDFVCTCPAGYTGGKIASGGCVDVNECTTGTPCGAGGTCVNTTGSYTCTCSAGYASVVPAGQTGPTCTCDLGGTYALVATTTLTWAAVTNLFLGQLVEASPPGGVATNSWSLRYQTVNPNGTLTVQTIPCGGTTPDVCDTYFGVAHAQYQPNQVWGKAGIDAGFPTVTAPLKGAVPGGTLQEPQSTALMGISLADPNGVWPPCRECVGVAAGSQCTCPAIGTTPAYVYTVVNAAQWLDADGDLKTGVTTYDVPAGGAVINNSLPDPPYNYTQPSVCPRIATPKATYSYSAWPNPAGFPLTLQDQWYAASRVISQVNGTTITFDATAKQCLVSGTLTGPAAGNKIQTDARIAGCEVCTGSGAACTPAGACSVAQADAYDSVGQTEQVQSATFTLNKLASIDLGPVIAMPAGAAKEAALNQACAQVRNTYCPAGKVCQ